LAAAGISFLLGDFILAVGREVIVCAIGYAFRAIRQVEDDLPDHDASLPPGATTA